MIAVVALGLWATAGQAGEKPPWPRFRGPGGSGVADGQNFMVVLSTWNYDKVFAVLVYMERTGGSGEPTMPGR